MKSRIKRAAATKEYKTLNAATKPYERTIRKLSVQAGLELGAYTRTRFEIGNAVSVIMKKVRDAKYPGGFKAYHADRKIQCPRTTCQTYVNAYQDIACLGLKDEVLNAAFAAGIDLTKHVGKIRTAKTEVKKMDGTRFVSFLNERPTRIQRPKLKNVGDFVGAGIIALKKVFDRIKDHETESQAWAGIALEISSLGKEEHWKGGTFSVPSPLATDDLEHLLSQEREV
jgi:hypothetical protein